MTALDIAVFEEHEDVVNLLMALNDERKDTDGSKDEHEPRDGLVNRATLSFQRDEGSQHKGSASEMTSDTQLLDIDDDTIVESKPTSPTQDGYLDDKDQQTSSSLEVPSALRRRPLIVGSRGGEIRVYDLTELLCKAKRKSKKKRSGVGSTTRCV